MTPSKGTWGRRPPPLTYTVALGVLQEALHAALPCLAVEGALGILACEACLAVMCAQLTLVQIWHTEAWSQGLAGWQALARTSLP